MKRIPVAFSFVLLISILIGCRSSHDQESFYPVLANAKKDGAIDRGWIPEFLPDSSRSIHEVHDLSPSTVWCAFEFDPADAGNLRRNLKSLDSLASSIGRVTSPDVPWWPKLLQGNLDVRKIQDSGLKLYTVSRPISQVETETLLVAIDGPKGRGYFTDTWSGSKSR